MKMMGDEEQDTVLVDWVGSGWGGYRRVHTGFWMYGEGKRKEDIGEDEMRKGNNGRSVFEGVGRSENGNAVGHKTRRYDTCDWKREENEGGRYTPFSSLVMVVWK